MNARPAQSPYRWAQFQMTTKKDKELWVFELFRDAFSDGPITNVIHEDAPDFRFQFNNKRVGLEVTELYHDSFSGLSASMKRSSFGAKFTEDVILSLSQMVGFTFGIGIIFNDNYSISSQNRSIIISDLVGKCCPILTTIQNKQSIELDFNFDLPKEIQYVRIVRYEGLTESFDFRPEGGTIPVLKKAYLEEVILTKQEKIKVGVDCDEIWLLIREGNYFAGSFSVPEFETVFETTFDRVYLMTTREKVNVIRIG